MKASFVTIFITALISSTVFAHGMNKPGPNGGNIRMPGTYHVELVSDKNILKIYFLDMNFKPISISNAAANVSLNGATSQAVECAKGTEYFSCDLKKINLRNYKEIQLQTSKAGEKAVLSTYKLPLDYLL